MSEGMWIALISASGVIGTAVISLLIAVINIIVGQSKSTISAVESERDYWKEIALDYRKQSDTEGGDG